jgi:hypothetical protein
MFIAYKQPSGQASFLIPAGDINDSIKDIPEGTEYKIVELTIKDRKYLDAYDFDADSETGTKINIERAKAVHLNRFRAVRTPKLQKLDIEYMKALEAGDTAKTAEIAAEKQALRDVTLTPLPDDFEGIKATWPEIIR